MKSLPVVALTVALASSLSAAIPTAAAQMYKGVDLYALQLPPHSYVGQFDGFTQYAAGGGQVVGHILPAQGRIGGLLWTEPDGAAIDFTPPLDSENSLIEGTDGVQQVGLRGFSPGGSHAALWSGTPDSAINLHPTLLPGFTSSVAFGLGGGQQVGSGTGPGLGGHALLWTGTPESAVDLHPTTLPGVIFSQALATDGVQQVGTAGYSGSNNSHAFLWNGSAASAVDLHLEGFNGFHQTWAYGVSGGQQVGFGAVDSSTTLKHALLWTGSAESVIDLNPTNIPGVDVSIAYATNGAHQVGAGSNGALLWSGAADSAVDLNALLPQGLGGSIAFSIDPSGRVYGLALDSNQRYHAVAWIPVPEPAALVMAGVALGIPCLVQRVAG